MIYIAGSICLLQLVVGGLAWFAAWEAARRLDRRGIMRPDGPAPQIVIAATGHAPCLETLCDAIAAQTMQISRLTFAVESTSDLAHARIAEVFDDFSPTVTTIVAGLAAAGGQKSRNLAAALRLQDGTTPIVLADVDIVPQPDWLWTLLRPIERGRADIVTGYRWPVPLDARVPTLLITWIDRSIAALPKPVGGQLIWGGSVALAPGTCERLGLVDRLEPEISDDLFLARLARSQGLRVTFPTAALLASPVAHDRASMFRFGHRQYQMIRLYSPVAYVAALGAAAINLCGTILPLFLLRICWWWVLVYGATAALSGLTLRARTSLGEAAGIPRRRGKAERRLRLLALLLPVIHAVHLAMIVAALRVRVVRWGRYVYRMKGRRVISIALDPRAAQSEWR